MKVVDMINHYSQFLGNVDVKDVPKPVEPPKEEVTKDDEPSKKSR